MATKSFDSSKPLATVVIKKKKVVHEFTEYFLFELIEPTITGNTHAIVGDTGECISTGKLVEGNYEAGTLITTGEIDGVYWINE